MARKPRRNVFRAEVPGTCHCYARCVRRAFLMGIDPLTGVDHDHRRDWVHSRLMLLVRCFAIDIGFVATMSNHVHLVLRTFPRIIARMGDQEVARRWLSVYPGKLVLDEQWIEPSEKNIQQLVQDKKRLKKIRARLSDISWFMKALNEYIARRCNLEDGVDGRFWQGRFGCRDVGSEDSLLICGVYVDLNQVRSGEAIGPEFCDRSSIGFRLRGFLENEEGRSSADGWLAPFTLDERATGLDEAPSASGLRPTDKGLLPMPLTQYTQILDWVGRIKRDGKAAIPANLPPILERLGIAPDRLRDGVTELSRRFARFAPPHENRQEQLAGPDS